MREKERRLAADAWLFVRDTYARPGASTACLRLQDEAGVDVIQLLMILWASVERSVADPALARQIEVGSTGWKADVIAPVRAARRELAERAASALHRHAVDLEREAEEQQVANLSALVSRFVSDGEKDASAAMRRFVEHIRSWRPDLLVDATSRAALAEVLGAATGLTADPFVSPEVAPTHRVRSMRTSMLQVESPTDEPRAERIRRVATMIEREVADHGPDLIVLPEQWPTGFFHFDRYEFEAEPLTGRFVTSLQEVAERTRTWLVGGSFVESTDGERFNTTVCCNGRGELAGTYRKIHLFGFESDESRVLTAGSEPCVVASPFGRIGLTTCYDLRFPELHRRLVDDGAEMIVAVSAWPEARRAHWRLLNQARAVENLLHVVSCNAAGWQGNARLAGTSLAIGPWGEIVAEGRRDASVVRAQLNLNDVAAVRESFPALIDRRIG